MQNHYKKLETIQSTAVLIVLFSTQLGVTVTMSVHKHKENRGVNKSHNLFLKVNFNVCDEHCKLYTKLVLSLFCQRERAF